MRLLALDTSSDACSAALLSDGQVLQRISLESRRHGELILGMVQALLAEAGLTVSCLDAVAFGRGPGSFTGVRIATAVAQGLAFGADLAVVPVSTLAGLAQGHHRSKGARYCLAAFDARMGELYWGCFALDSRGLMRAVCPEQVGPPEEVAVPECTGWHGVGSGWRAHGETLRLRLGDRLEGVSGEAVCESRDIAILAAAEVVAGNVVAPEHAVPVYLRDRVTATPTAAGGA